MCGDPAGAATTEYMPRSQIDTSLTRLTRGDFAFPLGVYPIEDLTPTQGCAVRFEASDGGDEGDWEEWPDRYSYDIVITASRVEPLCRALFALLPARLYPIVDLLGADAYREVDPYIAYDLVGFDRFIEQVHMHSDWFFEDGLVGFGAMAVEPFIYVFLDEHKIVTVRVETALQERVERILAAFDIEFVDNPEGPDAAVHEHRGVLFAPPERPDLMTAEEILESLLDAWRLRLNVDHSANVDDDGRELGVTAWRCLVKQYIHDEEDYRYGEVYLTASCLDEAELLALDAAESPGAALRSNEKEPADDNADSGSGGGEEGFMDSDTWVIVTDRLRPEDYGRLLIESGLDQESAAKIDLDEPGVHHFLWHDD